VVLKLLFPGRGTGQTEGAAPLRETHPGGVGRPDGPHLTRRLPLAEAPAPLRGPGWYAACKRGGDIVAALVLLALTAPFVLLAMFLIKLTSRGPVLYTQTRVGRQGRPFTIYKLRTMVHRCESLTGARWAVPGDPRVIFVGRFLRRTHLDELPQLWNVLRGDMSLVGPRPERPEFVPQLEVALRHYRERLRVRPGVTGLAQVQLPADTDLESVRVKLAYDLYYVRQQGFWLDVRILLSTTLKVLGLPFRGLRQLFRFPERQAIEASYASLTAEARALAVCAHPA
jgi:lipopolysaccharide/colanic/teichoic acid biosynthesis glycosyltransferase